MEALRQYIISVVCAAVLCGVVMGIFQQGTARSILKLVCGLFLAYTVLMPLGKLDISQLEELALDFSTDASQAIAQGETFAEEATRERIKALTEAYILDKATALGAKVEVEVTLDEKGLPCFAKLRGEASPYQRQQLQRYLTLDMGIAKENLQWTG